MAYFPSYYLRFHGQMHVNPQSCCISLPKAFLFRGLYWTYSLLSNSASCRIPFPAVDSRYAMSRPQHLVHLIRKGTSPVLFFTATIFCGIQRVHLQLTRENVNATICLIDKWAKYNVPTWQLSDIINKLTGTLLVERKSIVHEFRMLLPHNGTSLEQCSIVCTCSSVTPRSSVWNPHQLVCR